MKLNRLGCGLAAAEPVLGPLLVTAASAYVRLHQIAKSDKVVWDEAHFGKFGAYYILHEFYFDVHPPLGKLLVALFEYLAGFEGNFLFESGEYYPDHVDFAKIRIFNAVFGILVAPVSYLTAKAMGLSLLTVYLVSVMVAFENCFVVLSKFILLDSMLLFFTATTLYCLVKLHQAGKVNNRELTAGWLKWLFLTGVSIGCVCSVKWVGLFVTGLVGIYTVFDLFAKYIDDAMPRKTYLKHWALRIINLILVPATIYALAFKVHFMVLYKAGTGHASMPSLFQVNLEDTDIEPSPRNVAYGSRVTIRSHGLSPNLLHSHIQLYPGGSRQHQVTTYGHKDSNNDWIFAPSRLSGKPRVNSSTDTPVEYVRDGDRVRLVHRGLKCNLHSHPIRAHVAKDAYEVSGYGGEVVGDTKDDWVVEVAEQVECPSEPGATRNATFSSLLHPISTNFRLRHADLGCYLATTGAAYPAWGFKQGEVVCKRSYFRKDKSTWWNVEDHSHPDLAPDAAFMESPPPSNFWRDFILLNAAMQASNSALVPDQDRHDHLASEWWEWVVLRRGLRMSSWHPNDAKYYMMPNPLTLWATSLGLVAFVLVLAHRAYLWQGQQLDFDAAGFWDFAVKGLVPFAGWVLHYLPFVVMARVTYVHHYVPAEFFAIFVAAYMFEGSAAWVGKAVQRLHSNRKLEKLAKKQDASDVGTFVRVFLYAVLASSIFGVYQHFSPVCYGMVGPAFEYSHLRWRSSWHIHD